MSDHASSFSDEALERLSKTEPHQTLAKAVIEERRARRNLEEQLDYEVSRTSELRVLLDADEDEPLDTVAKRRMDAIVELHATRQRAREVLRAGEGIGLVTAAEAAMLTLDAALEEPTASITLDTSEDPDFAAFDAVIGRLIKMPECVSVERDTDQTGEVEDESGRTWEERCPTRRFTLTLRRADGPTPAPASQEPQDEPGEAAR